MKLDFTIEGITDLMTHNPISMLLADAAGGANGGKPKKADAKKLTREEQADMACYHLPDGAFGVPSLGARDAIIESAKEYKNPKNKRSNFAALLKGMEIAPMEYLTLMRKGKPIKEYVIDTRRAVNKTLKAGIVVHRPKFVAGWRVSFSLIIDDALFNLSESDLKEFFTDIINNAGLKFGIGSYRPACKGWFGKFKVV